MPTQTIEVLRIPGTLFPRGAFDENASYKFLNIVESGGNGYVCLQPCTGIPVTNTAYWFKFVFKGDKGDAFTYADLTAEQKAELVRDATAAAQAAASSAQSAADDAAAALQKFNTIKAAIDAIDPTSTEGSIQTLAAKQGLLEADLNALGPKIDEVKSEIFNATSEMYAIGANDVTSTPYMRIVNSTVVSDASSYSYKVIYIKSSFNKGDKIIFTGTTTASSRILFFGFTTTNPSTLQTLEGLEFIDGVVFTLTDTKSITLNVPYNGAYLVYSIYDYLVTSQSLVAYYARELKDAINRDKTPKENSKNLVESGGVYNELYIGDDSIEIDITQYEAVRAFPNPKIWITNNDSYPYYGKFIPITGGQKYRITGNVDGVTYYGFLTTNTYSANANVSYASGCTRVTVAKGSIMIGKAPADAKYLYVATYTTADRTPQKVEKFLKRNLADALETISEQSISINDIKKLVNVVGSCEIPLTANGTFKELATEIGKKYTLHVSSDWTTDNVTGTNKFNLSPDWNTRYVNVVLGQPVASEYSFVATSSTLYIWLRGDLGNNIYFILVKQDDIVRPTSSIIPCDYSYEGYMNVQGGQGGACFDKYFLFCSAYSSSTNDVKGNLYNLQTKTLVGQISFNVSNTRTHSNTVNFGYKFAEEDPFPLVYISSGYTDSTDVSTTEIFVFRLSGSDANGYTASLIQTITLDLSIWTEGIIDTTHNRLWVKISNTKFRCYSLPNPQSGDVTIDANSVFIDEIILPTQTFGAGVTKTSNQGFIYRNGRIWCVSGVPSYSGEGPESTCIIVINTRSKCREAVIWLDDIGLTNGTSNIYEPECLFFYDEHLFVSFSTFLAQIKRIDYTL